MFSSWFKTPAPLAPREKVWIERRLQFLADAFGSERLLRAKVLLPTERYFPDAYGETEADGRRLFAQLCAYMKIDPAAVELRFYRQDEMPGALGFYLNEPQPVVHVARELLSDVAACAATMTHELCHYLLLCDQKIATTAPDHELVTDLLQVFLGVGVFAANNGVVEKHWRMGRSSSWTVGKNGYLSLRMYAYAFAVFAWAREEVSPKWLAHLRPDVAQPARQGLNYLNATDDSLFQPHQRSRGLEYETTAALEGLLRAGTPGERVGAMQALQARETSIAACQGALLRCLDHKEADVRAEAAVTLGTMGHAAAGSVSELLRALDDPSEVVRIDSAGALGRIAAEPEQVLPPLLWSIEHPVPQVAFAGIDAVAAFGVAAERYTPELLAHLRNAWTISELDQADHLVAAVRAVCPNAEAELHGLLATLDEDVARAARLTLHPPPETRA